MTALVVVAGVLAAIILFRWARLLAMIALLVTIGYFVQRYHTWEAQQPPIHATDD